MNGTDRLRPRRWLFAGCVFDEANWTLVVDGRRIPIEAKPLELLRELLSGDGQLVTKAELMDRVWPDVHVVEASLTTAIHKLRVALGEDRRRRRIIETVPGLGYRLNVPATTQEIFPAAAPAFASQAPVGLDRAQAALRWNGPESVVPLALTVAGGLAIAIAAITVAAQPAPDLATLTATHPINQGTAANALRKLDVEAIDVLIAEGWDPNTPFDNEGTTALGYVLNTCEWDPDHDRRRLLLMARTLIDGGNRLDKRNVWGDTPYSIAKAERYCGPDHPVTRMIRTMCYAGYQPLGDRCLASYELERRHKRRRV
jgi:DNA-binding winged helix-turn-helix (wHTH) protein